MLFLSGHIPRNPDGSLVKGRIGEDYSTDQGYGIARQVTLSLLSTIKSEIGDLDNLEQIIRIVCYISAPVNYVEHPTVANGASDLLVALFKKRGAHSRVAVGVGSLPGGVPIEIELTAAVSS
jgi:enamine deaminase RidA (YjgF/YER057c/UK114 family)